MNERDTKRYLQQLLETLRSIQQDIHAIRENQEAANREGKEPIPINLSSELRLPVSISEHYESKERDNKSKWRKIRSGLEIIGVFSAFALAVLTLMTFFQIREQTSGLSQQLTRSVEEFRIDHRAWISVEKFKMLRKDDTGALSEIVPDQVRPSETVFINVLFKNYGSTPALRVCIQTQFETVRKSPDKHVAPHLDQIQARTTLPGFVLQPGGESFMTAPITGKAIADIRERNVDLYSYGRIDYDDAFGIAHWTTFCSLLTTGGGWRKCDRGNDTDQNPEVAAK
jgi:hypothetical protein